MSVVSTIFAGVTRNNETYNVNGDTITVYGKTNNFTITNAAVINTTNGGMTSGTNVKAKSVENVFTYGSAAATIISSNGIQNVFNNGSTTSTIVNNGASQNIHDNASAYVTILNSGGIQNIYNGGSAFYTTAHSGGYITTTQNGISFQPYIESGAYEDVGYNRVTNLSGVGSSISAQLYGGSQYIYSGSVESAATIFNGGASYILAGGSGFNTIVNSGGLLSVNGIASHTTLNNTAVLNVTYGGVTFSTNIKAKSAENVLNQGSATGTIISNNGAQNVFSNGSTTSTIVNSSASQNIHDNGSAYVTTLNNGGVQNIYNNGYAFYTIAHSGGYIATIQNGISFQPYIESGAYEDVGYNRVTNLSGVGSSISAQLYGGSQYIHSGSVESAATIFNDGASYILAGGSSIDTIVNSGGLQSVNGINAIASNTLLNNTATLNVVNGGVTSGTNVQSNSIENILSNGLAINTLVKLGGSQVISGSTNNFASATGTVVQGGAEQTIYDWGRADNITLSGGTINVSAGGGINGDVNFASSGTVNVYSGAGVSTQITNGGKEYIYSGGWTDNTIVDNASQVVLNGGKINNTIVRSNGTIDISTGGIASGITVNDAGILRVSGGIVNGTTINQNGYMVVNGGSITNNTLNNGAILNLNSGSIGTTRINSGASLVITIDNATIIGQIQLQTGGFLNDREALQDITINNFARDSLTTLLNDPTLFAPVNSNSLGNLDTDKNLNSSEIINSNKNTNSLNDLLNNPDYFAPITTSPQAALLQTADFVTPTLLSTIDADLPTTDGDGNPITWNPADYDGSVAESIDLRSYTVNSTGATYGSFIPPGHTERVWKIGFSFGGASTTLPQSLGYGGVLVYSQEPLSTQGTRKYSDKTYLVQGSTVNLSTKATISDLVVYDGATFNAIDGSVINLYVDNGGTANISDPSKLTGTLTLESGGETNITTSTGGIINLEGTDNQGLVISGKATTGGTTVASSIDNFDGNDSITLADVQRSDVASVKFNDEDHITITLTDGSSITLNIPGIETTGYSLGKNSDGNVVFETCFLTGTSIAMLSGVMSVESIQIGEIVETFDWKTNQTINSPVIWVGKKHMTVKTHLSDDLAGYPVRVLKNAISENIPSQDLLITPEHCLFFDGNFVPVRMLVNGRSIFYDLAITSYDYYHIETEQHSVIWANGTLTESYLDTGNRNNFSNHKKVVSLFSEAKSWDEDGAAPLNVQRDVVEPIYNQLNNRAVHHNLELQTDCLPLTNDPSLCVITERGQTIQPHTINNGKYIFAIPEGVNNIQLQSKTSRPCETIGSFIDDRRNLGVLVGKILIVNNNGLHEITDHLSDTNLEGWDVIEHSPCRWTNGHAALNIHKNHSQKRILIVNILAAGPYIFENSVQELELIAS